MGCIHDHNWLVPLPVVNDTVRTLATCPFLIIKIIAEVKESSPSSVNTCSSSWDLHRTTANWVEQYTCFLTRRILSSVRLSSKVHIITLVIPWSLFGHFKALFGFLRQVYFFFPEQLVLTSWWLSPLTYCVQMALKVDKGLRWFSLNRWLSSVL